MFENTPSEHNMKKENVYNSSEESIIVDNGIYIEMEKLLLYTKNASDRLIKLHKKLSRPEILLEMKETEDLFNIISQKWIPKILYLLFILEDQRYNELKSNLKGISSRTLSDKLKVMIEDGYITRKIFDESPPRVEYSLTEKGKTIARLIVPLIFYLLYTNNKIDGSRLDRL